ncbi:MAG: hypothetical protein QOD78_704 [Chloroflexota bacterium]|jgi:hypothetical protein|nr:hypothetical protein [Chloroflexota bacterium]
MFQRYRTIILGAALLAVVAVVGAGVFAAATEKAYACSNIWVPSPTPSPREGASPQPGYVQPDMGRGHVPVGTKITYTYCPPASGRHYAAAGAGPIQARVYSPNDAVIPDGWIHNLEHGGLVVLYKGAEVDEAALRTLFDAIPASPNCGFEPGGQSPGPVIARFDDMATPFAALVWGRVLPLQTLDTQAILDFYAAWGEKTNPEQQCTVPSASPASSETPSTAPATSPEPSSSAGSSAAPSAPAASGGAVAPSAPASASPS